MCIPAGLRHRFPPHLTYTPGDRLNVCPNLQHGLRVQVACAAQALVWPCYATSPIRQVFPLFDRALCRHHFHAPLLDAIRAILCCQHCARPRNRKPQGPKHSLCGWEECVRVQRERLASHNPDLLPRLHHVDVDIQAVLPMWLPSTASLRKESRRLLVEVTPIGPSANGCLLHLVGMLGLGKRTLRYLPYSVKVGNFSRNAPVF